MALNVSAISIRKPLPAIALALVMLTLGCLSFKKLPVTLLPNVDPPIVSVIVTQIGTPPSKLETQVTAKIENAVAGLAGLRHTMSSVSDGISATTLTFALDVDPERAFAEAKEAIGQVRGDLPANCDLVVRRVDAIGLGILTYAAISPGKSAEQLSAFLDDDVIGRLKAVPGVNSVERIGGVDREVEVKLDPDSLAADGLTAEEVERHIAPLAGQGGIAELAARLTPLPRGGQVRLDKIAPVTDTIAPPRTFARLNGQPIVAFSILRAKGASDVSVAARVEALVNKVKAEHPDFDLRLIDTSVHYTEGNYESALHTFFEGAALAVIIVFLFLRDLRATLIAAIALPLSIIPAFWVMDLLGFSLNVVSLLAVTLATGILVDDAIVEIENIVRHMRMGKSAYKAAMDAADEIGLAVIAISLTIVAVFAPVSFIGNIAGQYFKQFGLTIAAEVIFSLIAARLITPMLAAYFLKSDGRHEKTGRVCLLYGRLVKWTVENRYKSVLIGLFLFALSILSITSNLVSRDFQPTQDSGRSHLAIELPPGTALDRTAEVTDMVSARLRKRPEIASVLIDGGRMLPGTPEVRKAQLVINYVPKQKRRLSVPQLQEVIGKDLANVPDIKFWFVDDYGTRPVSRIVTGQDPALVAKFAAELASEMRKLPLVTDVVASIAPDRQELRIEPDEALAAKLRVSADALAETIKLATIGDLDGKLTIGGRLVPIRLEFDDRARANPNFLGALGVPSTAGDPVPLGRLAKIDLAEGPASITHFDRARSATIEARSEEHTS